MKITDTGEEKEKLMDYSEKFEFTISSERGGKAILADIVTGGILWESGNTEPATYLTMNVIRTINLQYEND